MGSTKHDQPGYSHLTIPSFTFTSGDVLDITIVYKSLNPTATKKALVPTCFSGVIDGTCTYSGPFNSTPTSALANHHILLIAMLGNGESSSPSNTPNFPATLDYRDNIRAQRAVCEHEGITELDVVLGFSMGGQQAYHWAAMYPDFVKNAVCICGSARTSPHNYAFVEGPIAALTRSTDYAGGKFRELGVKPVSGLRGFWRAYLPWLYSAIWYREEHWKKDGVETMAEFLDSRQDDLLGWDPEDLLVLARQWQRGDVGKVGSGFEETLREIKARMLVMPCRTDQYFPPADSEIEVSLLKRGTLAVIPSVWGHAAGGGWNPPDTKWVDAKIREFLASEDV